MRHAALLLILSISLAANAGVPPEVSVHRNRNAGPAWFEIMASVMARATPQHVWQVLTDYEHQPDYVPNLLSARVMSRDGAEIVLDQEGRSSFLFFQHAVHLRVRISEQPQVRIDVMLVSGDMKHYSARWRLTPTEIDGVASTRIDYSGILEPDFFVPPLIGNALVKTDVRKMLSAVVDE